MRLWSAAACRRLGKGGAEAPHSEGVRPRNTTA